MKYRVLGDLHSVSRGTFLAYVEDGLIELPEDMAIDLLKSGEIAPNFFPDTEHEEISNGGLHDTDSRQARTRQQRKRG